MGLMFGGKLRWRYRFRCILKALSILWVAVLGYEIAGYDHSNTISGGKPGC